MHAVCWNHPLIEYDQKNFAIHAIDESRNPNSCSQTLKITMPTYLVHEMDVEKKLIPSPPKFATFIQQKKAHCLRLLPL